MMRGLMAGNKGLDDLRVNGKRVIGFYDVDGKKKNVCDYSYSF